VSTTTAPDLAARIQDFWAYHPLLQIAHRETKQLVPLKLNQAQLKLYRERVLAAREGRPFRGNYLKARQVGISTVWQAMTAARAFTRANVRAITLAHDDQTTDELHSMLEAMYEHLPAEMKPKQRSREQGKRIVLEYPNGQISRIRTRTAGARVIGRGLARHRRVEHRAQRRHPGTPRHERPAGVHGEREGEPVLRHLPELEGRRSPLGGLVHR
jgi:hypothetical protein